MPNNTKPPQSSSLPSGDVASWIVDKVSAWETYRDNNYTDKWDEYYRIWRGVWDPTDTTRRAERSRIISPATQQAVEATVAELEEATFGRTRWIDIDDNIADENRLDVALGLRLLLEEFELNGIPQAISEIYLLGALYGTGIGKLSVEIEDEEEITQEQVPGTFASKTSVNKKEKVKIKLIPIDPHNFAIDPTARNINEALGCAHILWVPKHSVIDKIKHGYYEDVDIDGASQPEDVSGFGETSNPIPDDVVKIIEYHGKIPYEFIPKNQRDSEDQEEEYERSEVEEDYCEAIVVVANDSEILKITKNPFLMEDRSIIAYQHDTVPNRFFGRGVVEKAYNPQKALDSELRARIDSLAMSTYPMLAIDATTIPRGETFEIRPGKNIFLHGDPNSSIREFKFTSPDLQTYKWTADLERMIQMGTGAMDSATPVGINTRNSTASGMSMLMAGMIKRTKRTMQNIERNLLDPLVRKSLWRYMQFDPENFPINDYQFVVRGTMGIMAREFEQTQLIQLLSTVPPESPAFWILLKSIYENSSMTNKEEMLEALSQMMQQSMQPQQPAPPTLGDQAKMMQTQNDQARIQMESQAAQSKIQLDKMDKALKSRDLDIKEKDLLINSVLKSRELSSKAYLENKKLQKATP